MGMNIKNEEAHRLAQELAALTGESLTAAVTEALRERLTRLREEKQPLSKAERLMAIGRDIASRLSPEMRKIDHGELLYDEMGLPK